MKTILLFHRLNIRSRCILCLIIFFYAGNKHSQAQQAALLDWATVQLGTLSAGSYAMTTDAAGNVYSTGFFVGTTDFDPGPGVFNLTSVGGNNPFICKLDVNGNLVWAKLLVGSTADNDASGQRIALDAAGNVYTTGGFEGTIDFDPGDGTFNLTAAPSTNGSEDVFICKLDNNGNFIWAKSFGGGNHESVAGFSADAAGSTYVTGRFVGTVDFDPGPGVFPLTPAVNNAMFIARFDTDGNLTWAEQIGPATNGDHAENPYWLTLDSSGDIFITGTIFGNTAIDFDPGAGVFPVTPTYSHDIFILKLENDGSFAWVKTIVMGANLVGRSITVANSGNIYVTGQFLNTVDFDPGPGVANLVSLGGADPFVLKLDASGNYVWAVNFTGGVIAASDGGARIAVDAAENVYTMGVYHGSNNDFDPGPGTYSLRSTTTFSNTFVSKLDANGNFVWAAGMTGSNYTIPGGFSVHPSGNIYLSGYFHSRTDFDPGPCTHYIESPNSFYDIFVQKLRQGDPPIIPTFTSFSPTSGPVGTTVTITGTDFNTTPSENQVLFFSNRPATVTAATETALTVTVPAGTVTGLIVVMSRCVQMVSSTNFTVGVAVPTITGFTPTSGGLGETVTITGTNFSPIPGNNIVRFNGVQATVTASTATSITTTVPVGATTGRITVRVGSNTAISAADFTLTCLPPTITGLSPTTGAPGDMITITGTNFNTTASLNVLDFNGVTAVATSSTATSITTTVPEGATTGPVSVHNGCSETTSDSDFIIDCGPIPEIHSFSPSSGLVGTLVTITGLHFSSTLADNLVYFNGVQAVVTSGSETSIVAVVPPGATPGAIDIKVGCHFAGSDVSVHFEVFAVLSITNHPANTVVCDGGIATFTVMATGASNIGYQWLYSPDGITEFENFDDTPGITGAATATLTINTATFTESGYFRCEINGDLATAIESNVAHLSKVSKPQTPTTVSSSRCGEGAVTLTASGGTDGQYRWYTVATAGTAIAGAVNNTFVTPFISATSEYFVSIDNGSCESTRTPVTATVNPVPSAPSVTGSSACAGSTLTLNTSGANNGLYKWYIHPTEGAPLSGEVNATYTTPPLSETTTYYVTITNNGCESLRTPVTATIISVGCAPEINVTSLTTEPEGMIVIDLKPLIVTAGTLDMSSIKVTEGPPSGARTSVEEGVLTIDYKGISFGGSEALTIEACNTNGHCGRQAFTIEVAGDIVVYNGISPNGDGKNETFVLQYIDALPAAKKNTVSIYNRWGNEVFSVNDYDNNTRVFTGRSNNGSQLPAGTYYYKIHFPLQNRTVTGYLSLKH